MEIAVHPDGHLTWTDLTSADQTSLGKPVRCALGRGGVRADKREGDGATPVGRFPLRRVLWRADRLPRPDTDLPIQPIRPDDGWCDAPTDPAYNQPVRRPHPSSHESLWREDGVYDVIVVIGHNDDPIVPGLGSAVFLHVARPDWRPTAGCVALALSDLLDLVKNCGPGSVVTIPNLQAAAVQPTG
jgi:L,D-peptidoglycan transpeptidase YkuD (ErfK/YbiS/YcfS/YnhG family)